MMFAKLMSAALAAVLLTAVNGFPSFIAPPEISAQCPNPPGQFPLLLPNPTDCGSFYMCSWDMAFLQYCPSVLHFNPALQVCDSPAHFTCNVGNNNTQNPPEIDSNPEPESSEETEDQEVAGGNAEVATAPPEVAANCPPFSPDRVGMISDPTNCANFYMCLETGTAVLKNCPQGLFFNPSLQVCDFPENVQCGGLSV